MKLIVAFGQEEETIKRYEKTAHQTLKIAERAAVWQAVFMSTFMTVLMGVKAYVFFLGGVFIENGKINPQTGEVFKSVDMIIVYNAFFLAFLSLVGVLQGYPGVDHSLKVGRKVFDLLERSPAIESPPDPVTEIDLKEGIRFDRVKFR